MRPWNLLVLACTAIGLSACTPAIAAPGTPQAFAFACARPNEGHRIAVEGYLRLPRALDNTNSVTLRLHPDPSFKGKPIGVPMLFGDGADRVHKISSSYHDNDLKVYLADGSAVPFGTRVRVSGRMYFPVVPQDFECALQNPYVEAAK
jgi:hypothetical protein